MDVVTFVNVKMTELVIRLMVPALARVSISLATDVLINTYVSYKKNLSIVFWS